MKSYESDDILTQYLKKVGVQVEAYCLSGTRFVMGGVFHRGNSTIAYRFKPEASTVILSLYKREGDRQGLKNSFADLLWFFDLIAQPQLDIKSVEGLVESPVDGSGSLSVSRLNKFYEILGAKIVKKDKEGSEWMGGTVEKYRQWRIAH